jgi:hypothetical protein
MKRPHDQERVYVEAVLSTYGSLPGTPARPSRQDRRLARDLCRRAVPLRSVRAALLLAAARRTLRSGPPLPPVRTLHYFLPVIDEVLAEPPDPAYLETSPSSIGTSATHEDSSISAPWTHSPRNCACQGRPR